MRADPACASGERYHAYAEPDVAGSCYEPPASSTTATTTTTTGASASAPTLSGTATTADSTSTSAGPESSSDSSSGDPVPIELCNGVDDNDNGLVDEWSPQNLECELCVDGGCKMCDLFPDDEVEPTVVYYMCHSANYNQVVPFCTGLNAPPTSVHDDEEAVLLAIKVAEFAMYARAYLGLRNFAEPTAPAWTWVDGTAFDYDRLGPDLDMHEPGDECVSVVTSGDWEAAGCFGGQPFICEAPLSTLGQR